MPSVASIVLAAGESKRLGRPKQLLTIQGESLICRAVRIAGLAGVDKVVVVTGAYRDAVAEELTSAPCSIVHNECWQSGMGGSIACGTRALGLRAPDADLIILQVCDQPLITAEHLRQLMEAAQLHEVIAATRYPDASLGVPVCFPGRYLVRLQNQVGPAGAKSWLKDESTTAVDCAEAAVDIDVTSDWKNLH